VTDPHGGNNLSPERARQPPYGAHLLVDPPLFGDGDVGVDGMEAMLGGVRGPTMSASPNMPHHNSFDSSPMVDIPQSWTGPTPTMDPSAMTWDLISMGFEEALPSQDIIDALYAHLIFAVAS